MSNDKKGNNCIPEKLNSRKNMLCLWNIHVDRKANYSPGPLCISGPVAQVLTTCRMPKAMSLGMYTVWQLKALSCWNMGRRMGLMQEVLLKLEATWVEEQVKKGENTIGTESVTGEVREDGVLAGENTLMDLLKYSDEALLFSFSKRKLYEICWNECCLLASVS